MIVPICMHLIAAIFILLARDLPDGSYKELEALGAKQKSKGASNVVALGFSNTNALIMLVTYGLCFGVELCMNNKLVPYFTRYYAMPPTTAGPLGACFSLMNLFARSWGGLLSDYASKKCGMRGRITAMWVVQTIEGFFCILMGLVTVGMDGPDEAGFSAITTQGVYVDDSGTEYLVNGIVTNMPMSANTLIMIKDPAANCVHNGGTLGTTMLVMIMFSICVQMAEGLHF